MFFKIANKVKKFSLAILIIHMAMLFMPAFLKWSPQTGEISEQHSIINLLFIGIKPFTVILFILTIIVAILCEKILPQLLGVGNTAVFQGIAIILNLILLFILRSGYLNKFFPVGDTTVAFWYYTAMDIILIISMFVSYFSANSTDDTGL